MKVTFNVDNKIFSKIISVNVLTDYNEQYIYNVKFTQSYVETLAKLSYNFNKNTTWKKLKFKYRETFYYHSDKTQEVFDILNNIQLKTNMGLILNE